MSDNVDAIANKEVADNLILIFRVGFAAATGVLLWILSRVYELWKEMQTAKESKESFLRALYAEIDFNTLDLEIYLKIQPTQVDLHRSLSKKKLIPHMTDARHTDIYKTNIHQIHNLDDSLISNVVSFYGILDKIGAQIDALTQPSFKTISVKGQVNSINTITDYGLKCLNYGLNILSDMERSYPRLRLKRRSRSTTTNLISAEERLSQLSLKLDRIRSSH